MPASSTHTTPICLDTSLPKVGDGDKGIVGRIKVEAPHHMPTPNACSRTRETIAGGKSKPSNNFHTDARHKLGAGARLVRIVRDYSPQICPTT